MIIKLPKVAAGSCHNMALPIRGSFNSGSCRDVNAVQQVSEYIRYQWDARHVAVDMKLSMVALYTHRNTL